MTAIALVAGVTWTLRPQERLGRYVVAVLVEVLALSTPFLITPSIVAQLLP